MASAKRFPDGPAPPVLHYVVANLIGYVAVAYLYATLNDTPELWLAVWGQGYMVLACTFVAIVFSKIFSHRDCGGSPFFLLLFSASFQVCLAQVMVFVGWSSSGFNLDRFFSEWVGSSHPDNYWDVRVLWMFNAIMIKDMPWLIVYDCKLIGVHHVASCMGNFLVLHYQPDSARLMVGDTKYVCGWRVHVCCSSVCGCECACGCWRVCVRACTCMGVGTKASFEINLVCSPNEIKRDPM
eukprot:m.154516 g.154516  ORF g.154516 m.154516 type:complete len:239 (+) comp30892_c0_seq3:191-907(+)